MSTHWSFIWVINDCAHQTVPRWVSSNANIGLVILTSCRIALDRRVCLWAFYLSRPCRFCSGQRFCGRLAAASGRTIDWNSNCFRPAALCRF